VKYPAMLTAEARPSPGVSPAFHGESPAIPITVAEGRHHF
jgi:hypothetical protein